MTDSDALISSGQYMLQRRSDVGCEHGQEIEKNDTYVYFLRFATISITRISLCVEELALFKMDKMQDMPQHP